MSEIVRFDHSENIRLKDQPVIVFRLGGPSYINKKIASLLSLSDGDTMALYHTPDFLTWYIANDPIGCTVIKDKGLFRFSDSRAVRLIFQKYQIKGKKAYFPVTDQFEEINGIKVLRVISKPFNIS